MFRITLKMINIIQTNLSTCSLSYMYIVYYYFYCLYVISSYVTQIQLFNVTEQVQKILSTGYEHNECAVSGTWIIDIFVKEQCKLTFQSNSLFVIILSFPSS